VFPSFQGTWYGGQTVNLTWQKKQYIEPWSWNNHGFDYHTFGTDLKNIFASNYQLLLQSQEQCV